MRVTLDLLSREVKHLREISAESRLSLEEVATAMVELACAWIRAGKGVKKERSRPIMAGVVEYKSVAEAAEVLGLHPRLIYAVLHGKRRHTGGYTFTYKD